MMKLIEPVLVDVAPAACNSTPNPVDQAITPRAKAIIAARRFGLAAPIKELETLAHKHGLALGGDAACAVGATYAGQSVTVLGVAR